MFKPARCDLQCYKGQTFLQPIMFRRNKQPWSLAGMTAKAEVRPSENSTKLTQEITVAVYDAQGMITLYISAKDTDKIQKGFYAWDLKTVDEHDIVIPWLKGQFIVTGRVTE